MAVGTSSERLGTGGVRSVVQTGRLAVVGVGRRALLRKARGRIVAGRRRTVELGVLRQPLESLLE